MRRSLVLPLLAAVLVAPAAPAAHAGPAARPLRKSCNLLSDTPDDTFLFDKATGVKSPALDVRSVDIATGPKTIVAVMRLATTKTDNDNAFVNGGSWNVTFEFAANQIQYKFTRTMARPAAGGAITYSFMIGPDSVKVDGKSDGSTITWTAARSALPALKQPKSGVITKVFASNTGLEVHDYAPDNGTPAAVKYKDMTPSCIVAR